MLTHDMYAAMTGSILQHSKCHIENGLALCDIIAKGEGDIEAQLNNVRDLVTEIQVIRSDMDRALLFLEINDI